ncbi:hypothetical protein UFOVP419_3 [uncultured Caudovirales phage]|jgi:hypothetical protein|uniref:Uncharacterized protein n=1 Tax=uncultured Caudovirales phage TaxID=2100421 RepID=A0A6J5M8V8_9CAUD|nr:hypothetical protein UFOVP419_3 [uncultured Caudovirales phage]
MDSQARRILIQSILELQECLQEQYKEGHLTKVSNLWELQRDRAERLKYGNYYTRPHSRGTTKADQGDGQGS